MNQVSFGETDVKLDSLTLIFSGVVHFRLVHMGSRWGSSRTGGIRVNESCRPRAKSE